MELVNHLGHQLVIQLQIKVILFHSENWRKELQFWNSENNFKTDLTAPWGHKGDCCCELDHCSGLQAWFTTLFTPACCTAQQILEQCFLCVHLYCKYNLTCKSTGRWSCIEHIYKEQTFLINLIMTKGCSGFASYAIATIPLLSSSSSCHSPIVIMTETPLSQRK
jgi:hypothetical protein